MTRETLPNFQNRSNVTKIVDGESVSYLTQSVSFGDKTDSLGAVSLNTFHSEKKHVLFLFNEGDAVVGKFYIGKKLQPLSVDELIQKKHVLCFFESWNPSENSWVPCVGLSQQPDLAATAKRF